MNDRATRIANLSPEQRRLLESMLQERAQEARADEGMPALPRHSEGGQPAVFPLLPAQRGVWFFEQSRPGNVAHNGPLAWRLRGPLDVAALEASLGQICARHEALRTTFEERDGEPVQIVGPPRPVPLIRVDLRELAPPTREEETTRLLVREAGRPFDLSHDLMLRAALVRLDDEEHALLLVIHHIVSDGWSLDVMFRELRALYNASRSGERANLPELPVQYADYAVWQRQRQRDGALRRSVEYWKEQLADDPEALEIPTDRRPGSPVRSVSRGALQELMMPASLVGGLRGLCRRQNATLYMALLAGWAALLHRYSGQEDILVLTPFANRRRAEVEGLIGYFANVLVLRHDLAGDPSFAELLGRVRETALEAFSHGELPHEELAKELRHEVRAVFVLQNASRRSLKLEGLRVESIKIDRLRRSPKLEGPRDESIEIDPRGENRVFLSLLMSETDEGLTAGLVYNPDLFEAATVARMLGHLRTLLESAVADPERRLSGLPLPSRAALLESVVGGVSL